MIESAFPFLRQVKVTIGPYSDLTTQNLDDKLALVFKGDGTQDFFRIKFSIHKHKMTTATPTVVQLYNLKTETRSILANSRNKSITIEAGWINTKLYTLFNGSVTTSFSRRQGSDIVTDVMSLASSAAIGRSVVSKTWGANTELKNVIMDLAKQLPGVTVSPKFINVKNSKFGKQGITLAGSVSDSLDRLARTYGFSWHVNEKKFIAVDDKDFISAYDTPILSTDNGYLMRCEPMLATPWQNQIGTTIKSILHPSIQPSGSVIIDSKINPKLSGEYTVHTLNHVGDTHSSEWHSNIESWIQVAAG